MRLIILGSGSSGNSLYIESGETRVLVDVGLSAKETARRMSAVNLDPTALTGIVITHEHSDHVKGLSVFARTTGVPVYISEQTLAACKAGPMLKDADRIPLGQLIQSSSPFQIGELDFYPFNIPHDGVDTFAFTVQARGIKVGIVTDLGYVSNLVAERVRGCDLLIMESNHDIEMLKAGPYPWTLKQRVMSRLGHLSNEEMGRFLREDFDGRAHHIVLAHLSRTTNHPEIARMTALQSLNMRGSLFFKDAERRLKLAYHDRPTEWFEL